MLTDDIAAGVPPFDADRYLDNLRSADLLRINGKVRQVIGTVIESNGPPMSIGETANIIYKRNAEPVLAEAVGGVVLGGGEGAGRGVSGFAG